MRRTALLIALAGILAACADPTGAGTTEGANASASNSGSGTGTVGSGSDSGASGASTAGSSGSTGDCAALGTPVDEASQCCSGAIDSGGLCSDSSTMAGDSGSTTGTTSTSGTPTTTTSAGSTTTTSTTGAGFGGGTTSSACYPIGSYVGLGNDAACCSGAVDASGYCVDPNATTTTGSTTTSGATTTGTTTSGTTTGGTTTSGTTTGTTTGGSCSAACYSARGYHCDNGQCVLNGSSGPIQVTLLWDTSLQTNNQRAREDLDLHMTDPNGCEIYYANRTCGAGSLDLDQNPACSNTDNTGGYGDDTENIIYDPNAAQLHGTYHVYVDDYEDRCDGSTPNPFKYQVTIRYNGQTQVLSGQFHQGDDDSDAHTAPGWVHIADFNY